ncbi:PREDICTED: protein MICRORCHIDIA 7-like isoform X1 [Ipomoea nil]|uniref:protein MICRORCHIDIA 7-like isoform X1 n=1 Tax=Ipomoea nil TaxID=35883 RepID=UPI0009018C32|nr:PREDICTED: protein MICRORCHIDIA 7-like isoform X1 [Ipomoea nil]
MGNPKHRVKKEIFENHGSQPPSTATMPMSVIDLSSSDSDSDSEDGRPRKKQKSAETSSVALPLGFLDPLHEPVEQPLLLPPPAPAETSSGRAVPTCIVETSSKQFWKAGDFEGAPRGDWVSSSGGMDHVRVHPKFLHSNATSHKWVLGAFAELLDNSLDEVINGATYVNIDMVKSRKDGSRMLMIEDNGGGMDPDKIRQCMSLGYSAKSKIADTIGQYGNGFKTSTMRLGADVIVFSRCSGNNGKSPTQSIGLLSYTFLRSTGMEDIVVPMLDYENNEKEWGQIIRSSVEDWNRNIETIVRWSPFSSEADLLRQFNQMKDHGTRIVIYNLWEDDQGLLELDFDADPRDIQIRGVNRDDKSIQMAKQYPNSRHFLTYRHSLRSYASILYLRVPPSFRIILRGKDVEHHNIVNDMMMTQEVTYRPQTGADGVPKDSNMVAVVTIGFVKDAKAHIDVQGFNVYHKNRLIKPFWRLWNPAGSDGRGVIGVLEANFVEPAHDKQGFERTTVLARLEAKLVQMQKTYWTQNCHKIGYSIRWKRKASQEREDDFATPTPQHKNKSAAKSDKSHDTRHLNGKQSAGTRLSGRTHVESSVPLEDDSDDDVQVSVEKNTANGFSPKSTPSKNSGKATGKTMQSPPGFTYGEANKDGSPGRQNYVTRNSEFKRDIGNVSGGSHSSVSLLESINQLKKENCELKERLKRKEEDILGDLLNDLQNERERCESLEAQVEELKQKIEELNKDQERLIDIFSEERQRRDTEEENLRKKLKDASNTIQELLDKIMMLERKSKV